MVPDPPGMFSTFWKLILPRSYGSHGDLSVGRVHCFAVHILAVTRELSSADEILYLILQIEACRGCVTGRVMEQAELVIVLLHELPFHWQGG